MGSLVEDSDESNRGISCRITTEIHRRRVDTSLSVSSFLILLHLLLVLGFSADEPMYPFGIPRRRKELT